MYTKKTACALSAVIAFIVVLLIVSYHGYRNRIYASGTTTYRIDSPEKAYQIWKDCAARGRILILFDNYPHMRGLIDYRGTPQLTRSNLVEYSIFRNVIRKLYLVIPDAQWEGFQQKEIMQPLREVPELERGVYLYNLNGLPLIALPQSALPHMAETSLVYINSDLFIPAEVLALLSQKNIRSDVIISYKGKEK